jgi:TolA-binding protein
MAVEKSWAYKNPTGPDDVSANEVKQERELHDGKPLGKTYWSTHRSGARWPMNHVLLENGTTFFKYQNKADESKGGPGESLSHRLMKKAISRLEGTMLKLGKLGDHQIEIQAGEVEKAIPTQNGNYYADAYLRFTSTTDLGARWNGEIYIEVHHTHEVPVSKEAQLREMGLPVVEVKLYDTFLYRHEENSTRALEEAHVARICRVLQDGFLIGTVISDRRSADYLEGKIQQLDRDVFAAKAELKAAQLDGQHRLQKADDEFKQLNKELVSLRESGQSLATQTYGLRQELTNVREKLQVAENSLSVATLSAAKAKARTAEAAAELKAYRKKVVLRLLIGGAGLAGSVCICLLVWFYGAGSTPAQATTLPQTSVLQPAAAPEARSASVTKAKAPRGHRKDRPFTSERNENGQSSDSASRPADSDEKQ